VRAVLFAVAAGAALIAVGACGSSGSGSATDPPSDASLDLLSRLDAPIHVPAPCTVTIDAPAYLRAQHVAIGTHVTYDSNPPSSGPHYPIWAAYQAYDTPVPREYYVHDLEHGGVALLYKCDGACPAILDALTRVSNALPDDPLCNGEGVRVRTVITPDLLLDVPVAAAAWGWTYKADCPDLPSLTQFVKDHYGQGPEATCANGVTSF
jgi:hypothetical protein